MNTLHNAPTEISVSELSSAIKNTIQTQFSHVRVRGEITGVTFAQSGHIYMELKDETSTIRTVCWRSVAHKLPIRPENGLDVIITGNISTYDKNSTYQLTVRNMEPAGIGALLAMLEKRKKALHAEGLFDQDRKKPLPSLPKTIGVITSPSGAVIQDILHRVADRFPLHVILYPAKVQGEGTEKDVCDGITFFNNTPEHIPTPDVIIVARGGGSMEDLWAFNAESIVRAVAHSHIPIVSAIGHETDTTLIDYVSDVRAPTPTAAAEIVIPVLKDLMSDLHAMEQRLTHAVQNIYTHKSHTLETRKIPHLQHTIQMKKEAYENIKHRIQNSIQSYTNAYTLRLLHLGNMCIPPTQKISTYMDRLSYIQSSLKRSVSHLVDTHQKQTQHMDALLNSYSYKNTLNRGFALVHTQDNHVVSSAKTAQNQTALSLTFYDGKVFVKPK